MSTRRKNYSTFVQNEIEEEKEDSTSDYKEAIGKEFISSSTEYTEYQAFKQRFQMQKKSSKRRLPIPSFEKSSSSDQQS